MRRAHKARTVVDTTILHDFGIVQYLPSQGIDKALATCRIYGRRVRGLKRLLIGIAGVAIWLFRVVGRFRSPPDPPSISRRITVASTKGGKLSKKVENQGPGTGVKKGIRV